MQVHQPALPLDLVDLAFAVVLAFPRGRWTVGDCCSALGPGCWRDMTRVGVGAILRTSVSCEAGGSRSHRLLGGQASHDLTGDRGYASGLINTSLARHGVGREYKAQARCRRGKLTTFRAGRRAQTTASVEQYTVSLQVAISRVHAEDSDLDAALKRLGEDSPVDARGVPITQVLLEHLLTAALHDHGHAALTDVQILPGDLPGRRRVRRGNLPGHAEFDGATFQGDAVVRGCYLPGRGLVQRGRPSRATPGLSGRPSGRRRVRQGGLPGAAPGSSAATFRATPGSTSATFRGSAWFDRAIFQGDAGLTGRPSRGDAWFDGATFEQARQLGPLWSGSAALDDGVFDSAHLIEASAAGVSCQRARFPAGVQFRVRGAHVVMDDAELAAPSLLTGAPLPELHGAAGRVRWSSASPSRPL